MRACFSYYVLAVGGLCLHLGENVFICGRECA